MSDAWVIKLPWTRPPLSLNDRYPSPVVKAKKNEAVREEARWVIRAARMPALTRCRVELVYQPTDRRPRDTDNLVATLKPVCDALVLEGVVRDDTPDLMDKRMPRIGEVHRPGRLLLIVRRLDEAPGDERLAVPVPAKPGQRRTSRRAASGLPDARSLATQRIEWRRS